MLRLLSNIKLLDLNDTKRNQRITYLCFLLSAVFITISIGVYVVNKMFKVDKIVIKGNIDKVTSTQLDYVANNKLHGTFFTLDIDDLKTQFKMLPWVKDVNVERIFPSTIVVKFTEFNAIARVGNDDLLADNYEVFDGADDNERLPYLNVAPDRAVWAYKQYLMVESILQPMGVNVVSINSDSSRVFTAKTDTGLELVLCTQNLSNTLKNIQSYWENIAMVKPSISYMNFCYTNSVAIK